MKEGGSVGRGGVQGEGSAGRVEGGGGGGSGSMGGGLQAPDCKKGLGKGVQRGMGEGPFGDTQEAGGNFAHWVDGRGNGEATPLLLASQC